MKNNQTYARQAYKVIAEASEFLANITQVITFFLPIPAAALYYSKLEATAAGSNPVSFPLRMLILVACACVLGWGLGYCIAYLTRRNTSGTVVLASIIACIWGLMLVTIADGLTVDASALPEFGLFVLVGMGLIMWLMTFQLRAQANFGNATMVQDRTTMIAWFAAATVVTALLVEIGGAV